MAGLANGNVSVLTNNGSGFALASTSTMSTLGILNVDAGDVDGDGDDDIVVGDGLSQVRLGINNGAGSFSASTVGTFDTASTLLGRVKLVDINNDGELDLLSKQATNLMNVRLGNGGGGFTSASNVTLTGGFDVGDVNLDGNMDLLGMTGEFFLGNGAGGFTSQSSLGSGTLTANLDDVNGDGFLDAILTSGTTLYTFLNNQNGGFNSAIQSTIGAGARSLAFGDFDEDGAADLAMGFGASGTRYLGGTQDTTQIQRFNLTTQESALEALAFIDEALDRVGIETGNVGASMSRLEAAIGALHSQNENTQAAESQISSVDVAEEVAALQRSRILQNAGASILAQANLQGELMLRLIRG